MNRDLFGNKVNIEDKSKRIHGKYKTWMKKNEYGTSLDKKNCGNCSYKRKIEYYGREHYKCILMGVSHSDDSDVSIKYVCKNHNRTK